ncbi:hypothetical protein Dimus_015633 [Dionaea muscipula]
MAYGRPITGLASSQKLLQQPPSIHVKSHTSQWRATASMEPMPAVEHHAYASSEASISNGCLHPLSCLMISRPADGDHAGSWIPPRSSRYSCIQQHRLMASGTAGSHELRAAAPHHASTNPRGQASMRVPPLHLRIGEDLADNHNPAAGGTSCGQWKAAQAAVHT